MSVDEKIMEEGKRIARVIADEKTPASPRVVEEAAKNIEGAVRDDLNPPIKYLSREDLLEAENLQLRVMNLSLQEQTILEQLTHLRGERNAVQKKLLEHREHVSKKYDIDFDKCEIRSSDGAVLPKGSTPQGLIR